MLRRIVGSRRISGASLGMLVATAVLGAVAGGSALAQDPAAQVDQRQAEMKKLGAAMKTISNYVRNGDGSAEDVRKAAETMAQVHETMPTLWWEGTAVGVGDSEAKPEVWTDPEKFSAAIEASEVQAAELVAVSAGGDKAAIGAQLGKVGGACKACHEAYRLKD